MMLLLLTHSLLLAPLAPFLPHLCLWERFLSLCAQDYKNEKLLQISI